MSAPAKSIVIAIDLAVALFLDSGFWFSISIAIPTFLHTPHFTLPTRRSRKALTPNTCAERRLGLCRR